jgi:hypothetical protein
MADAYFYKGFVFECGVSSDLTIEGKPVPIEPAGRRFRTTGPDRVVEASSVRALAHRLIERSPALRRRRKERASHLKKRHASSNQR